MWRTDFRFLPTLRSDPTVGVSHVTSHKSSLDETYRVDEVEEVMGTIDISPKTFHAHVAFHWHRFAHMWPLVVITFATVLSFGWAVLLVWLVSGLLNLAM
jgi:hypothetical protein